MRRLVAITAFGLFLAVPVWAQRGGGRGGGGFGHGGGFGGGHGGFSGHVGGFSGGHPGFGGGHIGGGRSFVSHPAPGFHRGPLPSHISSVPRFNRGFRNDGFRGDRFRDRFRGDRFRRFGSRNNCFGRGCWWGWGWGYPWLNAGYYDPWWWDSNSLFDEEYERDRARAEEWNERNLEEQEMRREDEERDQDAYARPAQTSEGAPVLPPTVLVFRDQHKVEVQNYAIVGQSLWAFAPQHQKIALAELDIPATVKANDDRGVTFRVPGASEGQ